MSERVRPHGIYGVVHVGALPGDPLYEPSPPGNGFARAMERALSDADALVAGGCVGLVVENFGSAPFVKGTAGDRLPPHQVAALALIARACRERFDVEIGVNCLRCDAPAAIGIAAAAELSFVRVNVHVGTSVTDQGVIEGEAAFTLRYRDAVGARGVAIWADVAVKHATPLAPIDHAVATRDCITRGLADAVIVTGTGTGAPVDVAHLREIGNAAAPHAVVVGSGLTPENVDALGTYADAAIVGTYFKRDGQVRAPVDTERVRRLVSAARTRFRAPA